MAHMTHEQREFLQNKRRWITVWERVSYFALALAVWMAASLMEQMHGEDVSVFLMGTLDALPLRTIFCVALFICIRTVTHYYKLIYPDPDKG